MPYYRTLHVFLCCFLFYYFTYSHTGCSSRISMADIVHIMTACIELHKAARSVCSEVILSLLWQEKEDKAILQVEVQHLRQDNMRLQEESLTAAAQLRKFTEWFFHTIDKKPWWRLCQKPLEKHCTPLTYTSKPHSYCSSIRCRM